MKLPNALDFVKKMQMDFREAPFETEEQAQAQSIVSEVWCKQMIEALEKQIPKKPVAVLGIFGGKEYQCDECGSTFDNDPEGIISYCKWCGHAIDWSDVKDD